jgi:hypothetical protein
MTSITDFVSHRRDGHAIPEGMSLADMLRRGWPADRVVRVGWQSDGGAVRLADDDGLLARVVPGRRFVAVIGRPRPLATQSGLWVVEAGGKQATRVDDTQAILGVRVQGDFLWLEVPVVAAEDRFGVIFQHPDGRQFRLDVDAATGGVVNVQESR